MTKDFIIYPVKSRLLLSILTCLGFISIGVALIVLPKNEIIIILIGIITILFFGLCGIYFSFRLSANKPLLIISEKGLYDDSSYIGIGFIDWKEINKIYIHEFKDQKMIGIETADKNYVLNKVKGFKKILILINKSLIKSQINIPQASFNMPLEKIYELMLKAKGENFKGAI